MGKIILLIFGLIVAALSGGCLTHAVWKSTQQNPDAPQLGPVKEKWEMPKE